MEMTERRSIRRASAKPWSQMTMEEGMNLVGSDWCNDEVILRNRSYSTSSNDSNRGMGLPTRLKRVHIILGLLFVITVYHLSKSPASMLDIEDNVQVVTKDKESSVTPIVTDSEPPPSPSPTRKKTTKSETTKKPKKKPNPKPASTTPDVDIPDATSDEETVDDESTANTGDNNNDEIEDKSQSKSKAKTKTPKSINKTPSPSTTIIEEENTELDETEFIEMENPNETDDEKPEDTELDETEFIEMENPNETDDEKPGDTEPDEAEFIEMENPNETDDEKQADGIASTTPPTSKKTKNSKNDTTNTDKTKKPAATTEYEWSELPKPRSDADLSPTAQNFAKTHCNLQNLKDEAWYPSAPEDTWEQRAPYLIVAGVWNAGVNPLATALKKHPQIIAAKAGGFFLPKTFFPRFSTIQTNDKIGNTNNQTAAESTGSNFNVKVFAARERMYAQVYSKAMLRDSVNNNEDESPGDNDDSSDTKKQLVAMDVSPGYVFYAHKTAHAILCTVPWVKVVVLLRNPVDRLYRHWLYSVKTLNYPLSLEDFVAQEMKVLQKVGIIDGNDEADKDQPETPLSEKEKWEKYQAVRNIAGGIGRSLYVIQLEEWIQAYVSAGKTPSEEIIILTTEEIEEDPEHEYARLIRFLGLNDNSDVTNSIAATLKESFAPDADVTPMSKETRKMLRQFFKPYNKRLTELLTKNGFEGDWDKRWG